MKKILLILACTLSLTACKQSSSELPAASATQIQTQLATHQALLLDVRTDDEFKAGHVKAAILVPYDNIAQSISTIAPNKDQTIYLYCRSGRRSSIAAETLQKMGYRHIIDLGGLNDLAQYGLTVER